MGIVSLLKAYNKKILSIEDLIGCRWNKSIEKRISTHLRIFFVEMT